MEMIAFYASWVLIALGSFFLVAGALGMLRMPDVYTRMHAASVIDTLGATLLVFGLMIQAGLTLVALKLVFVLALLFFFGPVASHALAQAALHADIEPILAEDRRGRDVPPKAGEDPSRKEGGQHDPRQ
ncbi:MAG: monovalent cation/H(+) antiporter subunit G [Alphaproteobacteria bacterium]|nr:monovalent cation/H(+) antiporter subunit G [Alphaproteobacteria bacterium]